MKLFCIFLTFFCVIHCFEVPDIDLDEYFDENGFELPVKLNVNEIFNSPIEKTKPETNVDQEKIKNDLPDFYDDDDDEIEKDKDVLHETTLQTPEIESTTQTPQIQPTTQTPKIQPTTQPPNIQTTLKQNISSTSKPDEKDEQIKQKSNGKSKKDDKMTITLKVDKDSMTPTTIEVRVPTVNGERKNIMQIPNGGKKKLYHFYMFVFNIILFFKLKKYKLKYMILRKV